MLNEHVVNQTKALPYPSEVHIRKGLLEGKFPQGKILKETFEWLANHVGAPHDQELTDVVTLRFLRGWLEQLPSSLEQKRFLAYLRNSCEDIEFYEISRFSTEQDSSQITTITRSLQNHCLNLVADEILSPLRQLVSDLATDKVPGSSAEKILFIEARVAAFLDAYDICDYSAAEAEKSVLRIDLAYFKDSYRTSNWKIIANQEFSFLLSTEGVFDNINHFRLRFIYEDKLSEMPKFDWISFPELKIEYGAKGAVLAILRRDWPSLSDFEYEFTRVVIPRFELVPASVFKSWRNGSLDRESLRPFFTAFVGKDVLIRSSAVYSEDGRETMGAGIYNSVVMLANESFANFVEAIEKVYRSVDSQHAKIHQNSHGIREELMGLVIQERIDGSERKLGDGLSHVNTERIHLPDLLEVANQYGARSILKKSAVWDMIATDGMGEGRPACFYVPSDARVMNVTNILQQAKIGMLLEKYFGCPLQIEFCFGHDNSCDYKRVDALVQARPLPKDWSTPCTIDFPVDAKYLVEANALGVIDAELLVLGGNEDNHQKRGIIIIDSSYMASEFNFDNYLPKYGVVWMLRPPKEYFGHIETRALEKGLTVILGEGEIQLETDPHGGYYGGSLGVRIASSVNGIRRVRVVANGMRARIYPIESFIN